MIFERIKSEGISHNSYIVGSDGEAVVIDPRRDCQIYVDIARYNNLRIKHIFETHRNEDYVIGSIELGKYTGANIFHGSGLDWQYGQIVTDRDEFTVGKYKIMAIHTPGHTDESMSYVLVDPSQNTANIMVFTGDALFVNDVGRTDFYGLDEVRRLASNLYDSIHKKLLPLGDGVILCPAHGAGSVCGTNIGDRDESTLGIEKIQNPLLQKSKNEFIEYKQNEHLERAPYFQQMEKYNLSGPPPVGCIPLPHPLHRDEFKKEIEDGAIVVDTNLPDVYGRVHIKGAYNIWLEGLPVFAGWVLTYDKPILLVLERKTDLEKAVRYLLRCGFNRVNGYLEGGTESWYHFNMPVGHLPMISVTQLKTMMEEGNSPFILDVRAKNEWIEGHIEESHNIYVGLVSQRINEIPDDRNVVVLCTTGRRASFAASMLLKAGYSNVYTLLGSMNAWEKAGYPTVS
jgi:hydroxyacylglutathione hydrolase